MGVDQDGRSDDNYGFDIVTGSLKLLERTKDPFDIIFKGVTNIFSGFQKTGEEISLSKGVLNPFKDNSTLDLDFKTEEEGLMIMKFLSFSSHIEFAAWGYNNKSTRGLLIMPWSGNTSTKSTDYYTKGSTVGENSYGKTYFIQTHPGTWDGKGGYSKVSDLDITHYKKSGGYYNHYILSLHHNLTIFKRTGVSFTVNYPQ